MSISTTITGPDGKPRCRWSGGAPEFRHYHDSEWGFPASDDHRLFEKLSLEGFQPGLIWRTILVKRESFRAAFHGFDFDKVARFTERDVGRLLKDEGIVRHRGKIEAVINNAGGPEKSSSARVRWQPSSGASSRAARSWRNRKPHRSLLRPSHCRRS